MECRSRSRRTSIPPVFRPPPERQLSRRIGRNATQRSCSVCRRHRARQNQSARACLWSDEHQRVAALDAAAGFPILLYETVIELERYLTEHATGLDFASLMAQVKSPSVKQALASLRGPDAVSEATYREAHTKHRPALQETYR